MVLTRDKIRDGWVQKMVAANGEPVGNVLSEEELLHSRRTCLGRASGPDDVWVFGYGSLIWNPCFHFEERRLATARGWHRRFCLWTHLGRGTRSCPGLMLGLEQGGACRGVAFRLAAEQVETELDIIWRREMVTAAYRPIWVHATTAAGPIRAIGFAINRGHQRYAGRLCEQRIVEAIAVARGPLGDCAEYLFNTTQHLDELGMNDRYLQRLCVAVRQRQAESSPPPVTTGPTTI